MIVSPDLATFVETTPIHHSPEGTWFDLFTDTMVYSWEAYQERIGRAVLSTEKLRWLHDQQVDYRVYTEIRLGDHAVLPVGIDRNTVLAGGVRLAHYVGIHDPSAAFWYKIRFCEGKSSKAARRLTVS
jgi:hypothetical protein